MAKNQVSDKEVDNISTDCEMTQSLPYLPSCTKSYSESRMEFTTFEYTWKIVGFDRFYKATSTLLSSPFAEDQFRIEMNSSHQDKIIKFHIRTLTAFTGSCTTTVTDSNICCSESNKSLKYVSGIIHDKTLLVEIKLSCPWYYDCVIHCEIEIYQKLISNTMHMDLLSSLAIFKDMKRLNNSTLKFESKNEKSIKFVVGEESYIISKKLLWATNSSYFMNVCLTHEGEEKDMTSELDELGEMHTFKKILSYILTGSLSINESDYYMFKELLKTSDKYDVPTLKFICEHYLVRSFTVDNTVELVQLAFSSNAKVLETHLATFIKFHEKIITNSRVFRSLPPEDSNKIMELIKKSEILEVKTCDTVQ
ncbi:PREDICTED: uncharacterized protein LOC105560917 [Vollenhovia emeryi]|uniref:uncharacterized protein LOC105560917 n=1 Tax=Vollenhovia emeryi TaxID=411798 RepID=UPI0005F478B0|nr:PREDICTED: uncharacterized protein LOC105560917 [Vollenhovia emeryi]